MARPATLVGTMNEHYSCRMLSRRAAVVIAIVVAATAVVGGAALSAGGQSAASGPITGCWNAKTGAMRILAVGSLGTKACKKAEQRVTWNTSGGAGQRGSDGAAGAQGPAGPTGAQGPAGANGANGANGAAGTNGANGANGAAGTNGATGATGPAGHVDARGFARTVIGTYTNVPGWDAKRNAALAIGWDGLPVITASTGFEPNSLLAAACANVACTDSTQLVGADVHGAPSGTAAPIIGPDGAPAILELTPGYGIIRSACQVSATYDVDCTDLATNPGTQITPSGSDYSGFKPAFGTNGLILGAARTTTGIDVLLKCIDTACSAITLPMTTVTTSATNPTLAIGADGLAIIVSNTTAENLLVSHCANAQCSSFDAQTTISNAGTDPAVAIGADGLPLIATRRVASLGSLSVTHCHDVVCSLSQQTTIDAGNVGALPSIAIGADGLGVIAYSDVANGDLKIAHCSDLACTAATTVRHPTTGTDGVGASILIGVDGLPLISHADVTNHRIIAVHCASVFCAPYQRAS